MGWLRFKNIRQPLDTTAHNVYTQKSYAKLWDPAYSPRITHHEQLTVVISGVSRALKEGGQPGGRDFFGGGQPTAYEKTPAF